MANTIMHLNGSDFVFFTSYFHGG